VSVGAPTRILVLCTGNSCRSQLAEAYLVRIGGSRVTVRSAGTNPTAVHPLTIRVLAEDGIDWSGARSKSMAEFLDQPFDLVITVCDDAAEACPVFPGGGRRIHRSFADPARAGGTEDERLAAFRLVRDEIAGWVAEVIAGIRAPRG
jgi:arsenate reductase